MNNAIKPTEVVVTFGSNLLSRATRKKEVRMQHSSGYAQTLHLLTACFLITESPAPKLALLPRWSTSRTSYRSISHITLFCSSGKWFLILLVTAGGDLTLVESYIKSEKSLRFYQQKLQVMFIFWFFCKELWIWNHPIAITNCILYHLRTSFMQGIWINP